jgi:hypothetical protein
MASTYITSKIWITIGAMYGLLTPGCCLALAKPEISMQHSKYLRQWFSMVNRIVNRDEQNVGGPH